MSILDDGWGVRPDTSGRYDAIHCELVGVRRSRRWHRPESWAQVRLAQATFPRLNPVADRFRAADVVLDLSAGDSFTDLYGPGRLDTVTAPKIAALRAGRPLVLLPQTYGPFTTPRARRLAERIVRSATVAYARDPRSFEQLRELAGPDADMTRLRDGVDVAFALEPRRPNARTMDLLAPADGRPTAGVNVSGLLRDATAAAQFNIVGDYVATMASLVRALLEADSHVVLVPHVHAPGGHGESDIDAIEMVLERLPADMKQHTTVVPPTLDAAELKWCISRFDWFVGTRMHATIAALSTLTPAAAYAYSDKTLGVFETCGVGEHVIDARVRSGHEAVERLLASYEARTETRAILARTATATVERSRNQMREVLDFTRDPAPGSRGTREVR
ncbi:polysaccharide pyruvyl transferase family protein [Nocardioides flavus (ex Wang et al. 2016)]|uniref:polysaccharide pyruvyl transferase family protein n=1 Tax=Nocardioides flavus (ex Wang et al. 2016) TaxID=2058780 RepID=UPI00174ABDDD|nr:polysaccharide pyruvyl transferase family protein [Nocardioides flavus (ex Wang et al. 2016)]